MMTKTVTISDDLALLLEERAKRDGYSTLDAAVEALLAHGLVADDLEDDHLDGRSIGETRLLIAEAENSGPEAPWDATEMRREVLRRYAERVR